MSVKQNFLNILKVLVAVLNASTHPDFTNYFEKLPSNQIELALWLESDRMRSLKVTEENFQNQLETVKEEKRLRIDNQPYGPASIKMEELIFDNWQMVIRLSVILRISKHPAIEDVRKFFKTYYAPNNAVMAIVGDFDFDQMQKLVGNILLQSLVSHLPGKPDVNEPEQMKQKYLKLLISMQKLQLSGFPGKPLLRETTDYYALGVIEKLLSAGDSSRLYQRMVKGDQNALKVDAGYDERRGPSAFEVFAVVKPESTPDKVRRSLFSEIEKLKNEPVSSAELEKAKNQIMRRIFCLR